MSTEWIFFFIACIAVGCFNVWALIDDRKWRRLKRQEKAECEERDWVHMTERWEQAFAEDMECVLHHLPGDCPRCGAE